ncbi:MAG: metallophosphoesterase [Nanoarchaeota archaeon]|nr:metallophosphoesterase [Nanoarchaeota archaeon]
MGEIRLLQWSDMHGDLGKYRAIIDFMNSRDDFDAGLDLGDIVNSKGIVGKTVKEVLGEDDPSEYMQQVALMEKVIPAVKAGQMPKEEFQKKYGAVFKRIQAVTQKIVETHKNTYRSVDDIFADSSVPIHYIPGNHDLPHQMIPIKNAQNAVLANMNGPFFINNLRVFASVNTGYSIPGFPSELFSHLDKGMLIKDLEEKVKDIKDPQEKEAKIQEILMAEKESVYPFAKQFDVDLLIGHGQVGDALTARSETIDKQEWLYPAGALQLAKEKGVPYFGGHTHNAISSNKDGFPGYITDWDFLYEHVFDKATKKLKETIVYRLRKVGGRVTVENA